MSNRWKGGFIQAYFDPLTADIINAELYAWGGNTLGQLGLGDAINRSSPVQVGALTDWSEISISNHSAAVTNTGTLLTWGFNYAGSLGQNDTIHRSSPVQVGALTTWLKVSAKGYHTGAIKTDGTLWTWGDNLYGDLGDGTVIQRSSPVQVGADTDWAEVSMGAGEAALALKTDGSLWAWGRNEQGQLAQNNTVYRSSPVQIGALTNWSKISMGDNSALAVKTDGTVWAWGDNAVGRLGLNLTTSVRVSSPVQIGALTNWSDASTFLSTALAVKTDGTLWAWGDGGSGQTGLNVADDNSSPVQIGSLTDWAKISCGRIHSSAIKTDGTLWVWGDAGLGRLGNNADQTVDVSSPIQIGSSTSWSKVSAGNVGILATLEIS